jgi:Cu(I)/Ag(I) efflux system membrane fusion protein
MFAAVHFNGASGAAVFVPSEAVIRTGARALVMEASEGGRFQPVEVQVGRQNGDRTEILAGLEEGQKVVASGQFLIDSEASLSGLQARPLDGGSGPPVKAPPTLYETLGRVEALSGDQITFSHEPVPALGWPAMTMGFKLGSPALAKGVKVGDRVRFGFEQKPDGPVVRKLVPAGAQ